MTEETKPITATGTTPTQIGLAEGVVKYYSIPNNSFCLNEIDAGIERDQWYNVLKEDVATLVKKGQLVKVLYQINGTRRICKEINILKDAVEQPKSFNNQKSAPNFPEDITTFEDLLNYAHDPKHGLVSIETTLIESNFEKEYAVVKAVVTLKNGIKVSAHGDATQKNTGKNIQEHFLRMAETRAIARALRFATNNAAVAQEELNGSTTEK